jgi:pre-mRNA-splicing factor CWC26
VTIVTYVSQSPPSVLIMSANMKAYLAERYMSGPKAEAILDRVAPKKKKRRTNHSNAATAEGARVLDDDAGWGDDRREEVEDLSEAVIEKDRGFKKRNAEKGSGWTTLQAGDEEDAAEPADEQPMVVDSEESKPFVGGLISASQLHTVLPKAAPSKISQEEIELAKETVHRDAQGRKIDVKAARAEAARKKREKEEKEALMMEWGKGLVQREEKEKMKLELEKQKGKGFSRHADDPDLNEELKAKTLWNDPARAYLSVSSVLSLSSLMLIFPGSPEKIIEGASQTAIYWTNTSAQSIWHQTWLPMGWRWWVVCSI